MAWFDEPENSTGVLTTRLAVDASQVKGVNLFFSFLYLDIHVPFLGYWC